MGAVEGAGSYVITNGTETTSVDECEYTFTGEFATEYTLSVVAVPADEAKNYPSEVAEVTIAIGAELLATPVVTAEVNENTIKLTWEAITGADKYGITVGTEMPVFVDVCEYTFTGDYNTEYTFNVVAVADDEERYKPSNPATVTAKTEMPGVVTSFNKMEYKGYNADAYFFTFYLTNDNGDTATLYICDRFATQAGVKNASEWAPYGSNPLGYKNYPSHAGTQNGFHIDNINIGGVNYGKPTAAEGTGLTCEDGVITITAVLGDFVATMTIDQNNLVKPKQPRTVTVQVNAAMPEMYFYSWTDNKVEIAGSWPGTLMTNNGNGVFSYTYTEEWDGQTVNFVFNNGNVNGSNQTKDITGVVLDSDKSYERYDIWVPTYGLVGTFNEDPTDRWGADVLLERDNEGWYRIENFEFAADGEFLIRLNGIWQEENGGGKYGGGPIQEDGNYQLEWLKDQNIAIAAGTYNFAFNPKTAILKVEKVEQTVVPAEKQVNLTFFTDNGTSYIFKGDDGHNYLIAFRNYTPGTFSLTDNNKFMVNQCTWTANNTTYFGGTQFAEGDTLELIMNGSGYTATYTIIIRATVNGERVVATCANTNFQ